MNPSVRIERSAEGIVTLWIDVPDKKVNIFNEAVITELGQALDEALAVPDLRALVLRSSKSSFIAGADIGILRQLTDENDAAAKARLGQRLFERIAAAPCATLAVVHGACLGGGLELALACRFRIVSDHASTQLGLPEVNLGIIPGWGGSQRLPRLVGLGQAMQMMLTGKSIDGKRAVRVGLADRLVATEFIEAGIQAFLAAIPAQSNAARTPSRSLRERLLDGTAVGRAIVLRAAKKSVLAKTAGVYPAALALIDLVERTYAGPLDTGLEDEARVFGQLAISRVSKNLQQLFFTRESLKGDPGLPYDGVLPPVDHVGVVGAGVMGGKIAWLMTHRDLDVRLKDIEWPAVAKGFAAAHDCYEQLVRVRRLKPETVNVKMHRLSGTTNYSGFGSLDLVIEAIVENLDVKRTVHCELEDVMGDDAILCSNTSSLSVSKMAGALRRPGRFIGMHFFNPVNRMPLVEIIPGEHTDPATVATVYALAKRLGKTPVVVKDCAGFLVNRVLLPYMNESTRMLDDGVDYARVDRVLRTFGLPIGPFELADEVGLDIGYTVSQVLEDAYGDRMAVADLLQVLYKEKGVLGRKAGNGFYVRHGRTAVENPEMRRILSTLKTPSTPDELSDAQIVDRAILLMVNEAARCLDEGVVANAAYLDMAMIMGTGFPAFRGGLLRYADTRGIADVVESLGIMSKRWGAQFTPAEPLKAMAADGRKFYNPETDG